MTRPLALIALLLALPACVPTEPEPEEPTPDPGPYPEHCRDVAFDGALTEARVTDLDGSYVGSYDMPAGTNYTMKVIPQHPYEVTSVRAAFVGPVGPVRIRLTDNFGRSYPDLDTDLFEPIEVYLEEDQVDHKFTTFDVPPQTVFLEPTHHYLLVVEQLEDLALDCQPVGQRAALAVGVQDLDRRVLVVEHVVAAVGDPRAAGAEDPLDQVAVVDRVAEVEEVAPAA